jgi:phosphoribosylformylglycinamidine synthase
VQRLPDDVQPGRDHPRRRNLAALPRNRSEQFEARFVMVEVQESPSILLPGMAGSRMPIVVSHGEGRAVFAGIDAQDNAKVALRYVDNSGAIADRIRSTPTARPLASPA